MTHSLPVAFITSCRSDFAKLRPYISYFVKHRCPVSIFVTSMHVNSQLGMTREEMISYFPQGVRFCWDESFPQQQPLSAMAHLLTSIDNFFTQEKIKFVFVHGDRMEAFAAASTAAIRLLPICQIEAGDVSGNIDESFRHAITKLSHRFLVDSEVAKRRVLRLGEDPHSVFVTGSSAISLLPHKKRQKELLRSYHLPAKYAILLCHPETGFSSREQYDHIAQLVRALNQLPLNFLVLPPNNDPGYTEILRAYQLLNAQQTLMLPSLSCETYLTLLNQAVCLVGNSSSSIKDAPALGIPSIMLGSRQQNRAKGIRAPYYKVVQNAAEAAKWVDFFRTHSPKRMRQVVTAKNFEKKLEHIFTPEFFRPNIQKSFYDKR